MSIMPPVAKKRHHRTVLLKTSRDRPDEKIRAIKPLRRVNPYRDSTKPADQPQCRKCGAINIRGNWLPEKKKQPLNNKTICPACLQQQQQYAMGVVELHGQAWQKQRDDVWRTILKTEEVARSKNDQQRLIGTRDFRGITKVYVTLPQLARHVRRELGKSFKGGKVEYHLSEHEPYLRVIWKSDPPERRQIQKSRHWRKRGSSRWTA
jgi:NMD protein affecting ribosome stability and mRNA decay